MVTCCCAVAAPTSSGIADELALAASEPAEVAALFAEIDAILAAAAWAPPCRPPAPPATGCALLGPRCAGRTWGAAASHWRGPARPVRAVQRGPPRMPHRIEYELRPTKGR